MHEHELSYICDYDFAKSIVTYLPSSAQKDYYLDKDFRFRVLDDKMEMTQKIGNKASGYRLEKNSLLNNCSVANEILKNKAPLYIEKTRYEGNGFTVDLIEYPMKIGIIEIEREDASDLVSYKATAKAFGLVECPLSAWDYHKRKIGIMGGPSSGKTTVAKSVSMHLNNKLKANTSDVVEYATSFIQKTGRIPTFEDQAWIFIKQQEREKAVSKTSNITISDCPAFLSYIYATHALRNKNGDEHTDYAIKSLYKRAVESLDNYQSLFLLETINYRKNGVRYHNMDQSNAIKNEINDFIINHGRKSLIKEYNYNDVDKIINDILYMNSDEKIEKFMSNIRKYKPEVIPT